jgi:hypothetical protein
VWHASVARINRTFDAVVPVSRWDDRTRKEAVEIQLGLLHGVGTRTWERTEDGDSAIHMRRRLNRSEIVMLHQVNAACPVFTHGEASKILLL